MSHTRGQEEITMVGSLATTFNIIKMNSFCLSFIQGKNYSSWRLIAAFALFEPAFYAGILYMSHEMSLLNRTSILQKQCGDRKGKPFNTKNNFILRLQHVVIYDLGLAQGKDTDAKEVRKLVPRGKGPWHSTLTQTPGPRKKETLNEDLANKGMNNEVWVPSSGFRPFPRWGLGPITTPFGPGIYSTENLGAMAAPGRPQICAIRRPVVKGIKVSSGDSVSTELKKHLLKLHYSICLVISLMGTLWRIKQCILKKGNNVSK